MKLTSFYRNGAAVPGLVTERGILNISAVWPSLTLQGILEGWPETRSALERLAASADAEFLPPESVEFAPLTQPTKICCVGLNYRRHVEEAGERLPQEPLVFAKMPESLNVCEAPVPIPPRENRKLDFEAELVAVIGKRACNVPEDRAGEYIFGYTCGNDVSDREAQFRSSQMLIGKGCPGFAPVGPYLVTSDSLDPLDLRITCRVNGALRQNARTGQMIFSPRQIVSYISRYLVLNPGDLVFTGTPEGVIIGESPEKRRWLVSGDTVEVEIENIGKLRNQYI